MEEENFHREMEIVVPPRESRYFPDIIRNFSTNVENQPVPHMYVGCYATFVCVCMLLKKKKEMKHDTFAKCLNGCTWRSTMFFAFLHVQHKHQQKEITSISVPCFLRTQ